MGHNPAALHRVGIEQVQEQLSRPGYMFCIKKQGEIHAPAGSTEPELHFWRWALHPAHTQPLIAVIV